MLSKETILKALENAHKEQEDRENRVFDGMDLDDCFRSKEANRLQIETLETQLEIVENGGVADFPALYDLNGNLVSEALVQTRYGKAFIIETPDGKVKFVDPFVKENTLLKKGYVFGSVSHKAWTTIKGGRVVVFPTEN